MNSTIIAYLIYVVVSFSVILRVGHILYNSGKIYLKDLFPQDWDFANNVNRMLLIGYYLLVLGYALLELKLTNQTTGITDLFPAMAGKLALILLIIAGIHFTNLTWMYLYARYLDRKRNPELVTLKNQKPKRKRKNAPAPHKIIHRRIMRKPGKQ